ncbi:MAG TPA: Gfo/Idh/MocA family oxidoreductase, partial [Nitrospirae bacterium]|nr:Gfo/Idh/MocA family oxidoreductase [Nitrospirota bacterium]
MKALVIGCGSIGRRHISNLISSDRIDRVIVFTRNRNCLKDIDGRGKVETAASLETVEADFAVIANDTDKHIETALWLAGMGIDIFIEKPLSHNTDNIGLLEEQAKNKGISISLGYNLRFLGIMERIKKLLSTHALGKLYFAKIEVGQYLPDWREGTDYRNSYSVSADRGGGVALDLSHELDYMRYFFGNPIIWKVIRAKAGDLEMSAEDVFEGIYS